MLDFDSAEGFNVVEEVVVEGLDGVKEEKQLVPAARRVKLLVKKAAVKASKDNAYRWLNLQLQIAEGIDEAGAYKGKVVFGKVCYFADMQKYADKDFFVKKQHLVQLQMLVKALGIPLAQLKINDAFLTEITGKYVIADILQTKGSEEYGPDNEVKNFKEVLASDMV